MQVCLAVCHNYSGDAGGGGGGGGGGDDAEDEDADPYDLADPVDILAPLHKQCESDFQTMLVCDLYHLSVSF